MEKYTEGPWKIFSNSRNEWGVFENGRKELLAFLVDGVRAEPNARLMSAAPELLEVLEALLEEADMGEVDERTQPLVDAANAAIQKARGLECS